MSKSDMVYRYTASKIEYLRTALQTQEEAKAILLNFDTVSVKSRENSRRFGG